MQPIIVTTDLEQGQQMLLRLMQRINYGRIEDLRVVDGKLPMSPPPRAYREIKFGVENGPRAELTSIDFTLKASVRDMFAQIAALKDATIHKLEIKAGLPFSMTVEEHAA